MTTRIDRDAVRTGDTITWRTRNGGHEASGEVSWAVSTGAYVTIPGQGTYLVEWPRVESHTPRALQCPMCGGHELTAPHDNGYIPDATECACGARLTAEAATPGSEAHSFIWNSRNGDFREAGYTGESVNVAGSLCCGGREPLPVGGVAWAGSDGWLWCRMHLDTLLRSGTLDRLPAQ